jgi:diadenosine tetraphosphatase ApaH/serine/threonine PP2A family protein phosphatase
MSGKHGIIVLGSTAVAMRRLVISDIHANLTALEAVLSAAAGQWDEIWCLGDLVGYGPRPNECVALLREHPHFSLSGNHDWAALGKLDSSDFNHEARTAVLWTGDALTEETRAYLDGLPTMAALDAYTLAHGSPRHPLWEYVFDYQTAAENFAYFETAVCLVGHTHMPMFVVEQAAHDLLVQEPQPGQEFALLQGKFMINPGSVGQPRDEDPRAAYGLLDTKAHTWQFFRVDYDVEETQRQMRQERLPEALVARLGYGW